MAVRSIRQRSCNWQQVVYQHYTNITWNPIQDFRTIASTCTGTYLRNRIYRIWPNKNYNNICFPNIQRKTRSVNGKNSRTWRMTSTAKRRMMSFLMFPPYRIWKVDIWLSVLLTKPEIVRLLWDVLPDQLDDKQKEYKINNILRKLRKEGKISNTTIAGNKSTWALVNG